MTPMEQLVSAFGRNNVVVVAGTGVTAATTGGAPTSAWQGLLSDGVGRLNISNPDKGALVALQLEQAKEPADYASIAEQIKRFLGDDFGGWLSRSIGDLQVKDEQLIRGIGALGVPILTTNYDDMLERVLGRRTTTWTHPNDMLRMLRENTGEIGHLHGIWNDPESVVFSNEDYSRIARQTDAQSVQQSAFTMKTFLFIGVGDGLHDPNFNPMVRDFAQIASSSPGTHFRLCLNAEVDKATELRSVVDIGFGEAHDDLPDFISRLAATIRSNDVDLQRRSRDRLVDISRENSTMWRESEVLSEKTFAELVIPPTFLPEPHDQFATSTVNNMEKEKPRPVEIEPLIKSGGVIVIAGDENSGVSTAVNYCLYRAMDDRAQSHAILVDKPLKSGLKRIEAQVRSTYREWGVDLPVGEAADGLLLGIDNLRFDESAQFGRAIESIRDSPAGLVVIGVRQSDAASVVEALKKAGVEDDISLVYVGRFSDVEALELARRIAPGSSEKVAHSVMIIVRQRNLPRNPFTITLLIELIRSGVSLNEEESELAVLDKYLDLLLGADFLRVDREHKMTLRNKRKTLELLAQNFVERKEDRVSEQELLKWLGEHFAELGWPHSQTRCLNDLVNRRVLSRRTDGMIGFQRSTYLELMAGNSAKADPEFREKVLSAPIALASIVRTYAAMARDDEKVLEVVEAELDSLAPVELNGSVFGAVKKVRPAPEQDALTDRSESEGESLPDDSGALAENGALETHPTDSVYDDSDDSDTPAFLLTRIEDIPQWRLTMLTVDLVSRVLRDSDEVRNQELKSRVLGKVLSAWASFTELYERELEGSSDLDEMIRYFFSEETEDEEEFAKIRSFFTRLLPSVLTDSGIRYCLSGPSLIARLSEIELQEVAHAEFASLMRVLALIGSGGKEWIDALGSIGDSALKSFFCAHFIAGLVRYAYVSDQSLSEEDLRRIRDFLRRIINERYSFSDQSQRNRVNNKFEDRLRVSRLNFGQNPNRPSIAR